MTVKKKLIVSNIPDDRDTGIAGTVVCHRIF